MRDFSDVQPGDRVIRLLAETVEMEIIVKRVDDTIIWATLEKWIDLDPQDHPGNFWTFDRETGIEEDKDLGWGRSLGVTGSCLSRVLDR